MALADYLKFGEVKFGAQAAGEAVAQLEFPLADITKAIHISTVPVQIRKYRLSPEHLIVLAKSGLDNKQMEAWAEKSWKNTLTPSQLKESIKQGEIVDKAVADKNQHGVLTIHGIRMEAEVWLRRLGGLQGIKGLGQEEKQEITNEVSLFLEIHEAAKE